MSATRRAAGPHPAAKRRTLIAFLGLLLAICLMAPAGAQSTDPDDQYLNVYGIIQEADSLNSSGQRDAALAKYQQARTALEQLHKKYPNWNAKLIGFRIDYVDQKLEALSPKAPGAGAAPSTPKTGGEGGPATAAAGGVQVRLLAPGGEPRQALRLHPKAGDRQTITMTMKMSMGVKMGEAENPPMNLPPIVMTMELAVKDVAADITCDLALKDVKTGEDAGAQPMAAMIQSVLAGMKRFSGTLTLSDRGVTKAAHVSAPGATDAQSAQMLEQLDQSFSMSRIVLPEEAVGPGARWEMRRPVKSQGMNIDETATYELVSVDGDRLSLRSTVTQRAANQKIQNPAMPQLKVDLTQMTGKSTGTLTFDLSQLSPREAKMDYHSDMVMATGAGAQKQTIGMKLDLNLQFEGK